MLYKDVSPLIAVTEDLLPDSGTAGLSGVHSLLIPQHIVSIVKWSTHSQETIKSQEVKRMSAGKLVVFLFVSPLFLLFTNAVSIYHQPQESYCSLLVAYLKGQNRKSVSMCIYELVCIKPGMQTPHFPLVKHAAY